MVPLVCILAMTCGGEVSSNGVAPAAAAADGHVRLIDAVLHAPMTDGSTVAKAVGDRADAELALRRAVYDAQALSQARHFSDGDCEVDVSVSQAELRERLADWPAIAQAVERLPGGKMTATGTAQTLPADYRQLPAERPKGWDNVSAKGIRLAQQAAQKDCLEQLANRIGELQLTATRKVGALWAGRPELTDELAGLLENVRFDDPVYEPIQVCSVNGAVSLADATAALTKLAKKHDSDRRFAGVDFSQVTKLNKVKTLRATGYGVPPIRHIDRFQRLGRVAPPDWATQTLRATGRGSQPESKKGTAHGKLIAARAAGADARIKLARKIDALTLPPDGQTVRQFLLDHPELQRDVAAFVRSMRKVDTQWLPSGDATVTLEIPLRRLWKTLEPHLEPPQPNQ